MPGGTLVEVSKCSNHISSVPLFRFIFPYLFLLSFVASRGADADIAAFLQARGHIQGRDLLLAA
jgi:hypothetical protein